ncbi:hypothetical protein RB595_002241 [Gaeumannomyces hyphopodioides]
MGSYFSKTTEDNAKVKDDRPTPKYDKTSERNGQPARSHRRHVHSVAVIGAGYSGVVTAAHLSRYGFDVRVFERSSDVGGVWRFDARVPPDPPYPNERPQTPFSDQQPPPPPPLSGPAAELAHAPPGPCYAGLRNNVPTTLMRSTVVPWPAGTEEFVTHDDVEAYIRSIVDAAGVRPLVSFDTAVLHVGKPPGADKWTVRTRTLRRDPDNAEGAAAAGISFEEREWAFDAVVCASGHYQEPRVPDVPGLAAWKARFPDRVGHSRAYRDAATARFAGRGVLLVGAAVSSLDIVNEAAAVAAKVYQSSRDGLFDVPAAMLPLDRGNVEHVAGVSRFELLPAGGEAGDEQQQQQQLRDQDPIPGGAVHLTDGRVLRDVGQVVVATGYVTSYPYLGPGLQRPGLSPAVARRARDRDVVVAADGVVHHNLHRDMFYIPDPTLAFVGVPYYNSTFSFFDTQAQVVARVLAGEAALPPRAEMEAEFDARWRVKQNKGVLPGGEKGEAEDPEAAARWGKKFHSLLGLDETFTDELLAWINPQVEAAGGTPVTGPDEAWRARYRQMQRERAWRWKAEEED